MISTIPVIPATVMRAIVRESDFNDPKENVLSSITSRCSGEEPALLPRTHSPRGGLEREAKFEPKNDLKQKVEQRQQQGVTCHESRKTYAFLN